ncbi:KEOPS complex subunit Cgi121 [Candidatus Nitrosotalea bavarica]|uniref:KEOPS complex subunit Cgi121 n=1 Tax=Candidatus Nitrosotalea bavarica TaxID=1903277 RepID=UPI000C70DB10|nr:KEOPS complex subunit Cgi121 [Candidatus Nitrosotalea bavarica]
MLTVKLLGGARKSFSSDKLEIESDLMTISDLLDHLEKSTPSNLPHLDPNNILVAVNGIDSSALQGKETLLKGGDVISIIPLVHGGRSKRIQFGLMKNIIELVRLKKTAEDPITFIESLRERYPNLVIQGIGASYVLNVEHVQKTVAISLSAQKAGTLLSNKIETDILMRFACTRQISDAISKVGVKKNTDSILIIIGKKSLIEKLYNHIKDLLQDNVFSKDNSKLIKKEFRITKKQLDCVFSKTPLEDLLAEKSATLFH